jgi:hypothetical protein
MMTGQRRGASIAMTDGERDAFLRSQPVCRVATLGPGGHPHVSALWFVWDGSALWLNSLTRSQRWTDIGRDPRLSVIVDEGGADFLRLRGIEVRGSAQVVGEVPRTGEARTPHPPPHTPFMARSSSSRTSTWAVAVSGTTAGTAGSGSPRRRS